MSTRHFMDKLDELINLLDNNIDIKNIENIKNNINKELLDKINNYRLNPCIKNKEILFNDELYKKYIESEMNLNYLIMEINSKFKEFKNESN